MIAGDILFYVRKQGIVTAVFNLGFWSLLVYRAGHSMHGKLIYKILLLWYLYLMLKNVLNLLSKIELPPTVKIGHRFNLVHAYGLVMGDKVVIGDDVTVGPWTVLGHNGIAHEQPIIGNRVYIGAKASILGGIFIGDEAIVGVNTVLTKSLGAKEIAKVAYCQISSCKK